MSEDSNVSPVAPDAPADTGEAVEAVEATAEELEAAAAELAEKEKVPESTKRKFNARVNNRVREVEIDMANDADLQRYIQKALAADEKFEEAATMRKAIADLVSELKTNPKSVLKHEMIGLDLRKFAEQILNEELEEMEKSPEQKKLEEMERKLRDYEEEKKRLMQEKEQSERARINEEALQQLDDQISSALSKSDLPKSPYIVKRIADTMYEAVNLGYTDVTVDQIMPFVEQQITGEISRMFEEAPDATASKLMERLVGKKSLDRYRTQRTAKMRKPTDVAGKVADTGNSNKPKAEPQEVRKQKFSDVFGKF